MVGSIMSCSADEYKELAGQQRPEYVIVGNDPYPKNAMGIAFCKESWKELKRKNESGYHLLNALGIDIAKAEIKFPDNASDFFCLMLEKGLVFWNASEIKSLISLGLPSNSIKSIICGPKAEKCFRNSAFLELCNTFPFYIPRHPCPQGADFIWEKFWSTKGILIKQLISIYKNTDDLANIIENINNALI